MRASANSLGASVRVGRYCRPKLVSTLGSSDCATPFVASGPTPGPWHRRCPLSAACTTSGSETFHTAPCRSRPHCSSEESPSRSAPLRSLTGSYPPSPARLASADVLPNHPATHAPSAATRSPMHFPRTLSLSVLVLPRERLRLQVTPPRPASLPLPRRRVARPSHRRPPPAARAVLDLHRP